MNSHPEYAYLNLLKNILENGEDRTDRTGVGTRSMFGAQMRFNLEKGFPAITTKKLAWRAMSSELIWFISGSGDERKLKSLLHGDPESDKPTIWTENANSTYWKSRSKFKGDLGRIYGMQWRTWRAPVFGANRMGVKHIDQLQDVINKLKSDPYSRRHLVVSYNPGEIELMALPPCHVMFQFYVSKDSKLSCHMYQRSADFPLGVPFNIASYALLTHMVAQVCQLQVGELVISFGDAHIYQNQIEGVKEQLERTPMPLPTLWLNPKITRIEDFNMDDMKLLDYQSHPTINFPFAV
jgi:thymidylate synthase